MKASASVGKITCSEGLEGGNGEGGRRREEEGGGRGKGGRGGEEIFADRIINYV